MSGQPAALPDPVTHRQQLTDYLAGGCKPQESWRIGTEHEKFVFEMDSLRPVPYRGRKSIHGLLSGMQRFGWEPVRERANVVALRKDGCAISLEPGGQLELSGQPLDNVHQTCEEVTEHLHQVKEVATELGVSLIGLGHQPKWTRESVPWMPRGRYQIMRRYLPTRGRHGLDMMLQTCSVQVNLDYASEADMVRKFRVALSLQPLATALFANSPFQAGRAVDFLSFRSYVWTQTDADRCGMLPFVFEEDMGFERYVDYALDVPMFFVVRNGAYIDAAGQSFRDFLHGRLDALPGEIPTLGDWSDHLTTLYPEVRMKRFLEMRGADGGPWRRLCALPALWVGLLYDPDCLQAAWELVREWSNSQRQALRADVPRLALEAPVAGATLGDLAREVLGIAREGLRRRRRLDVQGHDESIHLGPLDEIVETGRTPAHELIEHFERDWHHDVTPVFDEYAY